MPRPTRPLPTSLEELNDTERVILNYTNEGKMQTEISTITKFSRAKVSGVLKRLTNAGLYGGAIRGKQAGSITQQSRIIIDAMLKLIEEFSPRTLRAYYYQLVVMGVFPNNESSYVSLVTLMGDARRNKIIPYDAFVDSSRPLHLEVPDYDMQDYVDSFRPYRSDWWKDQEQRITLWIEKDALMNVVEPIAHKYHVDLYCGKGGVSLTRVYEAAQRINDNGQDALILYMGDFDPTGIDIENSLFKEMGELHDCHPEHERIAVTYDQAKEFEELGLSNPVKDATSKSENPNAAQKRGVAGYNQKAAKHREKYGNLSVEVDAFNPKQLQDLVSKAIEAHCDMAQMRERQAADEVVNARILKALQPLVDECQDYE